ncbi:MAG: hypothetical protein O7J95_00510, partial [Planctomycetota bacterium]|nr:hypothetical protein [Planctomycetota bacterium]
PPPPGIAGRLSRKLGVEVRESGQLPELRHSVTFRRITVRPRLLESGPLGPGRRRNFRWARLEELGETVPVSSMCLKIARNLRRENGTPRSAT